MDYLRSVKYAPPHISRKCLRRPRIHAEFECALQNGNLFLHGKSGYGKSLEVSLWICENGFKSSWLNLDELDNDAATFCKSLAYSMLAVQPKSSVPPDYIRTLSFQSPVEDLFTFIHLIEEGEFLIILDNFQLLTNKHTLNCLYLLIRRLPKNWMIILISQIPPPSDLVFRPFPKQMTVHNEKLLKFNSDEIRLFFEFYGQPLSSKQFKETEELTEGWVSALCLLLSYGDMDDGLKADVRSKLYHFFWENSWKSLSRKIRLFLLHTCLLEEIRPFFCRQETGISYSEYDIKSLEYLNIFLFMKKNGSYYYHPLYKEFLIGQLELSGLVDYKKEFCLGAEALLNRNPYHALFYYLKGENYEKLLELTLTYPCWITDFQMDEATFIRIYERRYPPFLLILALLSFYEGRIKEGINRVKEFESRILPETGQENLSLKSHTKFFYLYLFIKIKNPIYTAFQVLDLLKENQRGPMAAFPFAGGIFTQSGISLFNGAIDFSSMLLNIQKFQNQFQAVSNSIFGNYGKIFEAVLLSEAFFEHNEPGQAMDWLKQAQALCTEYYEPEIYVIVRCRLAVMQYALNQKKNAFDTLSGLRDMFTDAHTARLNANWNALYIRLRIWEREEATAAVWVQKEADSLGALRFYRIEEYLTTVYALYVVSDFTGAAALLDRLLILCKSYGRIRYTAELYLLKSLCLKKLESGDERSYLPPLYEAVLLGQRYKLIQVFMIMENTDLLSLLIKKASEYSFTGISETYVKQLISAVRRAGVNGLLCCEAQHIRLSKKQGEMLLYLSRDMSYAKICEATGLKITTVRTHISNLYEKLLVSNKKEALKRASELGFFNRL